MKPPLQVKGSWRSQTVKGRRLSSTVPGDLVAVAAIGLPDNNEDAVADLPHTEVPFGKTASVPAPEGFVRPPLQLKGSWKGNSAKSQSFKRSASSKGGMPDDIARALSAVKKEEDAERLAAAGGGEVPAEAPLRTESSGSQGAFVKPPLQLKGSWRADSAKSQSFKRSASGKDSISEAVRKANQMVEQEEADKAAGKVAEKEDKPFVKPPLQGPKGSWRSQSVKGRRLSSTVPTEMFQLAEALPPVAGDPPSAQV